MAQRDRETILRDVIEQVERISSDIGLDLPEEVGPETRIVAHLDWDSMDRVLLMAAFRELYGEEDLSFEALMGGIRYPNDWTVGEIAAHLHEQLNVLAAEALP